MKLGTVWVFLLLILLITAEPVGAQETTTENVAPLQLQGGDGSIAKPPATVELAPGDRWMLICCGLPGDEVHREKLTMAVEWIVDATEPVFQVAPNRLRVLVGDDEMAGALNASKVKPDICTAEETASSLRALAEQIQPNDSLWIIFMGHAQLYAGRSTFNIKGKDFDAKDLAKWLAPVQCRERVFMLTMPVSGFWIKPLRAPKTVLITATDADFEFTGTEMPYALANVVSGNSENALKDIDQDGSVSVLDLYLATCLEVHSTFKNLDRLQTEHAQIDDNGDGTARELQQPYLPVETPEGEVPAKPIAIKKVTTANSDGDFASKLKLIPPTTVPRNENVE